MEEIKRRRKYDREFKREAVGLVIEGKRTIKEVAQELGIQANMLQRWKQEYLENNKEAFRGSGKLTHPDEEMRKLVRENAVLKEERDILKKALAIFSKGGK
jgi:transposase